MVHRYILHIRVSMKRMNPSCRCAELFQTLFLSLFHIKYRTPSRSWLGTDIPGERRRNLMYLCYSRFRVWILFLTLNSKSRDSCWNAKHICFPCVPLGYTDSFSCQQLVIRTPVKIQYSIIVKPHRDHASSLLMETVPLAESSFLGLVLRRVVCMSDWPLTGSVRVV